MRTTMLASVMAVVLVAAALGCGGTAPEPAKVTKTDSAVKETPITPVTVAENKPAAEPKKDAAGATTPVTVGDSAEAKDEPPKEEPKEEEIKLPDVVAKVGDDTIKGSELARLLKGQQKMMAQFHGGGSKITPEQQKQALDNIISQKVLLGVAKKAGVEVKDEEVKAEFEKQKANLPSDEVFKKYLEEQGLTEQDLLGLMKDGMTIRKFVEEKTKDVKPSDEDIAKRFEEMKANGNLKRPEETYDVAHILVKVDKGADDAAWAKAKEKIDAARERIVKGEKFADVAKEVSDDPGSAQNGGVYKDVGKGKMVPEFEEKMLSTPVGEVSEPFKTQYGWHILTVLAKHEAGEKTLDDVKDDIAKTLSRPKQMEVVKQMIEDARKETKIETFLPEPPEAPKPAEAAAPEGAAPAAPAAPAAGGEAKPAEAPPAPAAAEEAKPAEAPKAEPPASS